MLSNKRKGIIKVQLYQVCCWLMVSSMVLPQFGIFGVSNKGGLKKVLVLDIKNVDKNASYQYLEASLTDATLKLLKEKFAFRETDRKVWEGVAKKNYIHENDMHTYTAAMNLGLLTRQDIVIAGGYTVDLIKVKTAITEKDKTKKKKSGVDFKDKKDKKKKALKKKKKSKKTSAKKKKKKSDSKKDSKKEKKKPKKKFKTSYSLRMNIMVRIYDIAKRKVIAEIKETSPVDARLFAAVDRIAKRIAEAAKKILPNKDEWQKLGIPIDQEPLVHQINLFSSMSVASVPEASTEALNSNTVSYPNDAGQNTSVGLEYQYHDFYLSKTILWGRGLYSFAETERSVEKNTAKAMLSATGGLALAGIGLRLPLFSKLYATVLAGGGFYFGSITIDYGNLPNKPTDSGGSEVTTESFNTSAPSATMALRLGLQIAHQISFEIGAEYTHLFYIDKQIGFIQGSAGIGMHF